MADVSNPLPGPQSHILRNHSAHDGLGKTLCVSGASGFLGSHFLFWRARMPGRFIALARGVSVDEAERRILERIEVCTASYRVPFEPESWRTRLSAIRGDVTRKNCGVDEITLAKVRDEGVDEFWHFAFGFSTDESHKDALYAQNVTGTRNALDFARSICAKRFIHVSTAYTAGRTHNYAHEELHPLPGEFNNFYEESQCLAEHEVATFCRTHQIDYRILRPSTVIGPSLTLMTGGCTTGLYGFVKELLDLRSSLPSSAHSFPLAGNPTTQINLIPVDHMMADVNKLIAGEFAGGPIYHLTSASNLTAEVIVKTLFKALKIEQTSAFSQTIPERTSFETTVNRRLKFYCDYLQQGKEFERSLPGDHGINRQELHDYVMEYMGESQEAAEGTVFRRTCLRSRDDIALCAFTGGNSVGPAVVLVNAIGIPAIIWLPLAKRLAAPFRFLTWESRWVPNSDSAFDPERCAIGHHVEDLVSLLDANRIEAAHIIGWCNGAQVALKFASLYPERALSLVIANGAFNLPQSVPRTHYEKTMRASMPEIASSRRSAQLFHRLITGSRTEFDGEADPGQGAGQTLSLTACVNPALRRIINTPFRTPELLYRYAHMISQSFGEPEHAWAIGITAPTMIIACSNDQIAAVEAAREIAGRIKGAHLVILEGGNHHGIFDDVGMHNIILNFLA
ncbi:MAG TPA: alpha/beta fold hydrolase [Blastocatellia bacterium]|nr:alpha/beta fold hydrolase [Blastocatellia bacterium]